MPYDSDKQRKFFHANPEKVGGKAVVKEFDKASKGKDLPESASKKGAGAPPAMHAALPHACCGKPAHMHKGAGAAPKSLVQSVMAKNMAKSNATMLANMNAPKGKKRAGY